MAVIVTRQTIADGPRNLIVKCHLASGGVDVSDQLLIDASSYDGSPSDIKIIGIKAMLGGFRLDLHWDATANVDIISIPGDEDVDQCYRSFGGYINNSTAGKTGDILFSTNGIQNGDEGMITLEMVKRGH